MRGDKKKTLAKRGWIVGQTSNFLDLSLDESAYIELKLRLGETLRARRQRADTTQAVMAELLGTSQSRVAKMEAGDSSDSLDLLVRALLKLGASERELAKVIAS